MQIVLTFDDGLDTHYSRVGPLLKSHGFGASFFITRKDVWSQILIPLGEKPPALLTPEEILSLYNDGFDIGNHTFSHSDVAGGDEQIIVNDILALNSWFLELGIATPITFSYPTFRSNSRSAEMIKRLGFKVARTGFADTPDKMWHANPALRPKRYYKRGDDPFRVYTTAILNCNYSLDWFKRDIDECPENGLMIMSGHGVTEDSVWNLLQDLVRYLSDNGGKFVSLQYIEKEFNVHSSFSSVNTHTVAI